jgi:hypothetical protein
MRRFAVISAIAILGLGAVANQASAAPATQDINFNGEIGAFCTFSNTVNGTLGTFTSNSEWVEGSTGIPNLGAGQSGSTTVNCNGESTLSTGVPVQVSAPAGFTPQVLQSVVYDGTNYTSANTGGNFDTGAWNKPTAPLTIPANTNVNLKVGMVAGRNAYGNSVPGGTYSYKVTLTATPN